MNDEQAGPSRLAGTLGDAAQRASKLIRTARAARTAYTDRTARPVPAARSAAGPYQGRNLRAGSGADISTGQSDGAGAAGLAGQTRPVRVNGVSAGRMAPQRIRIAGGSRPRSAAEPAASRSAPARARGPMQVAVVPPVPSPLAVSAAYAWRLLIVGVGVYVIFELLLRFELVFIAVFLALVFSSLLRPFVSLLARIMPRPLAVLITLLSTLAALVALFWGIVMTVTDDSTALTADFRGGLARIETWLEGAPFRVKPSSLTGLQQKLTSFIATHQATLINQVVNEASTVAEIFTVLALAVFCSIFFMNSGDRMWHWFEEQLPQNAQPVWNRCGRAAWHTFAGYARGTIIIAGTNAILVGISLYVLGVPLALPLTVLEFFLSFIPLAGSPIAMAVATVVALAGRGPTAAITVLILIVVIGQIEGHVLQPLVMGWSVRLHPVAVALSVISGGIVAGFLGAVVAVPLVSIVWAVTQEIRRPPESLEPDETLEDAEETPLAIE